MIFLACAISDIENNEPPELYKTQFYYLTMNMIVKWIFFTNISSLKLYFSF